MLEVKEYNIHFGWINLPTKATAHGMQVKNQFEGIASSLRPDLKLKYQPNPSSLYCP
jgi:hypothetical protein